MDRWTLSFAAAASLAVLGHPEPARAPVPTPEQQTSLANQAPHSPTPDAMVSVAEFRCLALNVYYEARGESPEEQLAVARVTLNRVQDGRFAGSICAVVQQKDRGGCQFGWYCRTHRPPRPRSDEWRSAQTAAVRALVGDEDPTKGALYFNRRELVPRSKAHGPRKVVIGRQAFYR